MLPWPMGLALHHLLQFRVEGSPLPLLLLPGEPPPSCHPHSIAELWEAPGPSRTSQSLPGPASTPLWVCAGHTVWPRVMCESPATQMTACGPRSLSRGPAHPTGPHQLALPPWAQRPRERRSHCAPQPQACAGLGPVWAPGEPCQSSSACPGPCLCVGEFGVWQLLPLLGQWGPPSWPHLHRQSQALP